MAIKVKIWVLRPFQEHFTYIEPIVYQRWAKTGVPGEKPPGLPVKNLAYHMYAERPVAIKDSRNPTECVSPFNRSK